MAHQAEDRVRDTTTTTGTGAVTVSGTAPTGYKPFSARLSVSDTFVGLIAHQTADEWEIGLYTYSASNQVTRTIVHASTNADSAVSFSAGTKDVILVQSSFRLYQQTGVTVLPHTVTANAPALDISQTWNNAVVTFSAITVNVTDTNSLVASLLMDLQVGAVSKFNVVKDGSFNGLRFIGSTSYTGFEPSSNALGQVTVGGSNGGGLIISDGAGRAGFWTSASGTNLIMGVGGTSAGIPTTWQMASTGLTGNRIVCNNASTFDPSSNALGALTMSGSNGGGIVINDSGFIGFWSDSFGTRLNIGVNGTSGGISPNLVVTTANLFPNVDNGMSLGIAGSNQWSNLFLADGAVINWNNGNLTLTHSAGALTLGPTGTNLAIGTAAISTTATDGFLYIPTCAGTPIGTPTTFSGRVPMVFDTTNSQFWFFTGGAWKQPKTPAGAATVTWQ